MGKSSFLRAKVILPLLFLAAVALSGLFFAGGAPKVSAEGLPAEIAVFRVEAESGVMAGITKYKYGPETSGGKVVADLNTPTDTLTLTFYAPFAGDYTVKAKYYTDGIGEGWQANPPKHSLSINGSEDLDVPYPENSHWTNDGNTEGKYATLSDIALNAGENTLVLKGAETGYADIDAFDFIPSFLPEGFSLSAAEIIAEAEDGTLTDCEIRYNAEANNGAYVGGLDDDGAKIEFEINTAIAGDYYLYVYYMSGFVNATADNLPAHSLSVNSEDSGKIFYTQNTGWGGEDNINFAPGSPCVISLNTGGNTVALTKQAGDGWAEIDYIRLIPVFHTITYKNADGSAFSGTHENGYPQTHCFGIETVLKGASRTNYSFEGWYDEAGYNGGEFDGTAVTSLSADGYKADITLYAKLEAVDVFTVTFISQETEYDAKQVNDGDTVAKPADPVRNGYNFKGWYESADSGVTLSASAYDFDAAVTADLTLYAKWEKKPPAKNGCGGSMTGISIFGAFGGVILLAGAALILIKRGKKEDISL